MSKRVISRPLVFRFREYLDTFSNFVCNFSTSVERIIETVIIGKILVPDRREGRKTKTRE